METPKSSNGESDHKVRIGWLELHAKQLGLAAALLSLLTAAIGAFTSIHKDGAHQAAETLPSPVQTTPTVVVNTPVAVTVPVSVSSPVSPAKPSISPKKKSSPAEGGWRPLPSASGTPDLKLAASDYSFLNELELASAPAGLTALVGLDENGTALDEEFSRSLHAGDPAHLSTSLFNLEFVTSGLFKDIFDGRGQSGTGMAVLRSKGKLDRLVLLKRRPTVAKQFPPYGIWEATAAADLKVMDIRKSATILNRKFEGVGKGTSQDEAIAEAIRDLVARIDASAPI